MKRFSLLFFLWFAPFLFAQDLRSYTPFPRRMVGEQEAELRLAKTILDLGLHQPQTKLLPAEEQNPTGRVRGVLPEGWVDNSSWAKVWTEYSVRKHDGIPFLRMEFTKQESGRSQIQALFDPEVLETGRSYQLSIRARSPTRTQIQIGLRHRGAPYRFIQPFSVQLEPGFKKNTFEFQLSPSKNPLGFYVILADPGVVEIESLTLSEVDEASMETWVNARFPNGLPANLIRNTQFPLGLQTGWSLDRNTSDGDEMTIRPDPSVPGTRGIPSLKMETRKPDQTFALYTLPVELPLQGKPYRMAIRIKGTGKVGLQVFKGEKRQRQVEWTLEGGDWQTHELIFTPKGPGEHILAVTGSGSFHLDTIHVHEGAVAIPFQRQGSAECALTVNRFSRLQFEDEPSTLQYAVMDAPKGATLRLKVVTPYHEEMELASQPLQQVPYQTGSLDWHHFEHRPYGVFRIEAFVADVDGKRISPVQELVVHRLRRPRYWGKDAPNSPFGVHTESAQRHLDMTKAIGINWVRLHDAGLGYIGWFWVEPEQGKWTFFDDELERYRKQQLLIFGELGTAPTWASYWTGSGRTQVGYFDRFFQPRDLKQYQNYVKTVVTRYRDVIRAYDVWNEPWIAEWWGVGWDQSIGGREGWKTSAEPQKDFARMMKTAFETVKEIDEEIQIAGFNTTSGGGSFNRILGTDWTRGVLKEGGMTHSDMIAFHMYEGGRAAEPGCAVTAAVERALHPLREKEGEWPRPVWMTEGSHRPGGSGTHFYYHTLRAPSSGDPFRESEQLVRYQVANLANQVSRIFLYSMHSHRHLGLAGRFNVLVTPEGYLNPSAAAQSTLAWHLEDTVFRGQQDLPEKIRVFTFAGPRGQVQVICPHRAYQADSWRLPRKKGIRYEDLFGNPLEPGSALGVFTIYAIGEPGAVDP